MNKLQTLYCIEVILVRRNILYSQFNWDGVRYRTETEEYVGWGSYAPD